jgi:hypothetical protein
LRIIEDYYKVIQRQIKEAVRNPIQIHPDDEKRIEKIFCNILEKNIEYGVDDVYVIIDALEPKFSKYTKNIILEIALYKLRRHSKKKKN